MGQFIFGLFAGIVVGLVMEWVIDWAGLLPDRSTRKESRSKKAKVSPTTERAEKATSRKATNHDATIHQADTTASARSLADTDASGE